MTAYPKKIWGSALLLVVAAPVLFSAVFLLRQQYLQNQMREKIEQSALQIISLPASSVKWVASEKEILVDGKLFDVQSVQLNDGVYTFSGLFDTDEDNLITEFRHGLQHSKNSSSPIESLVVKFLSHPLIDFHSSLTTPFNNCTYIHLHYPRFTEAVAVACLHINAPPPKMA
ncbi:MAG: hypothetical protein JST86_07260 [Bacteroidetes bacterium]|nr:hypothetical protein [Bacteroidota bacterium]